MLQGVQTQVGEVGHGLPRGVDAEDATRLLRRVIVGVSTGDLAQGLAHLAIVARSPSDATNPASGATHDPATVALMGDQRRAVTTATAGTAPAGGTERDRFIDFVRAFSLLVVVAWHWVFTIIVWKADGPHASNPIGFTRGLFIATWLFQVMPLFFFVGGYAHTEAWEAGLEKGRFRTTMGFAWKRAGQLARPALALAFGWWLIGSIGVALYELDGVPRAVRLILSPLWFILVYLLLIALFPVTHWLHERYGALVIVWGVGLAVLLSLIHI